MIKAAIFDVDKTLLSHKGRCIPQSAVYAIEDLRKEDTLIILATGRPIYALDEVKEASPWAFTIGGAFFENKFGICFENQINKVCEHIKGDLMNNSINEGDQ